MEKTYIEQIRETVDGICDEYNLGQPIVVPAAARMIAEHKGVDVAIELFEGAYNECITKPEKDNPFAFAAYKSTLEKLLIPMRDGENGKV
jgi:arginine decarboxylase-like protein